MTDELQTKLDEILLDKNTNLLPEHLKAGVTCLGVEGRMQNGCKLFETEEKMQNDSDAKLNDLAAAYSMKYVGLTVDSIFNQMLIPETVTLPSAVPDTGSTSLHIDFKSDNPDMFSCYANLHHWDSGAGFSFTFMGSDRMVDISYTSTDAITFTLSEIRDDFDNAVQDGIASFNTNLELTDDSKIDLSEYWNYFIQSPSYVYSGLCQYRLFTDRNALGFVDGNKINCTIGEYNNYTSTLPEGIVDITVDYNSKKFINIDRAKQLLTASGESTIYLCMDTDGNLYRLDEGLIKGLLYSSDNTLEGYFSEATGEYNIYQIAENNTETLIYTTVIDDFVELTIEHKGHSINETVAYKVNNLPFSNYCVVSYNGQDNYFGTSYLYPLKYNKTGYVGMAPDVYNSLVGEIPYARYMKYFAAPSSLNAEDDYVFEKTYDGKNGVSTGTLNEMTNLTKTQLLFRVMKLYQPMQTMTLEPTVTDLSNFFYLAGDLYSVPLFDTSNVKDFSAMFVYCNLLTSIPAYNTSNATNMNRMIEGCTLLVDVPILDTSNVLAGTENWNDGLYHFANDCPALSDNSLNNIMQMCVNATSYEGTTKTLAYIGLTEEQATKCATLSNYEAFTTAGWTTGY